MNEKDKRRVVTSIRLHKKKRIIMNEIIEDRIKGPKLKARTNSF